jgi:hypothetical protein
VPRSVASDNAANNSPDRTGELPVAGLEADAPGPVMRQFYTAQQAPRVTIGDSDASCVTKRVRRSLNRA